MSRGVVAAGHPATAEAGVRALEEGGNAFDAVVAATWAACVAEPILASPAGGGFLLASPMGERAALLDFFTQTPLKRQPEPLDFQAIDGDFGKAVQVFHIGMAACATPGVVAGLFEIQARLCRLPMRVLLEPAVERAREGVVLNAFQAYINRILEPILRHTPAIHALFHADGRPLAEGQRQPMPELADFLEVLGLEGRDLFYRGEAAQALDVLSRSQGGHLRRADLEAYSIVWRKPRAFSLGRAKVATNAWPSLGGPLIAQGLEWLQAHWQVQPPADAAQEARDWVAMMAAVEQFRRQSGLDAHPPEWPQLDAAPFRAELARFAHHPPASRGTTHISVADAAGNLAALTLSNGECNGHVLPGTGVLLNNMLGEEDLNPGGFHRWPEHVRLASMMAPTVIEKADGQRLALGSGGSNRIRSAISQVLLRLLRHGDPLQAAIAHPRLHYEQQHLDLEPGLPEVVQQAVLRQVPDHRIWPEANLFFGGVHAVARHADGRLEGAGDPRRGGCCRLAGSP